MMNISESAGESSCKRQENGDVSTGSDRPLKKARFAWQVKGKYHLKNEITESSKSPTVPPNEPDKAVSSSENESNSSDLVGNTEQNLEILGDYLLKQDFNTLDSVITDSDKSILKPSTSIAKETIQYPRYVSSYDNNSSNNVTRTSSGSSYDFVPVSLSMLVSQEHSEDQCIARWQARQMAKGFVDNTINRVLDSWMVAPLPADMVNNRFLALDVAEFINNLPGDNSVENEGILMAISAHGLQNTSSNSEHICSSSSMKDDSFPSPPSSPLPSDDESTQELVNSNNKQAEIDTSSSNELDMSWADNMKKNVNDDLTQFNFFPDTSSSSYHYFSENDHLQTANIEYDGEENVSDSGNNVLTSHYDFLDAAVSFAIQNKGLTSFGTDYG